MKGIIFTEFLELVEARYGLSMTNKIFEYPNMPAHAAYTAVGTYSHTEMIALVMNLSEETGIPASELLITYGRYLFGRLANNYPDMTKHLHDSFDFLEQINDHIHVEVRKLYPDSKPPMIKTERLSKNHLQLLYVSHRKLADVAEGLILGCGDYFHQQLQLIKEVINEEEGTVRFTITRQES